jgi:hypothetical protein
MQCTQYLESIHELTDGTIGPIRRAELERHLAECPSCRALADDLRRIQEAAASLDTLAPPDGVWLQIAGRLRQEGRGAAPPVEPPRHHYVLVALAAMLLMAVGASMVVLVPQFRAHNAGGQARAADEPGNAAGGDAVQSVEEEFRLAEQHYQNAISKLEQAARLDQADSTPGAIDPQTAAMLQKNLRVIDQAIAESRAALGTEPQSAPARDSLFDALKRKLVLLQDTIALMNEMRKGNAAGATQIADGLNKS